MSGTLYIVATPIGNLEDITYRAVRVLNECDTIACEDTRQTRKLLDHYGIRKPLLAVHEHNERERAAQLVEQVAGGGTVALVSDAGTPLISDPGYRVVAEAVKRGVPITPIPGPSAPVAALSVSGLATDRYLFAGFLPAKSGQRRAELASVAALEATVIYFEAPHRLIDSLRDAAELLPRHPMVIAREVTKRFEEFLRGTAGEIAATLEQRGEVLGEITWLIGKEDGRDVRPTDDVLRARVQELIAAGVAKNDAMKQVARAAGLGKSEIYKLLSSDAGTGAG